MNSELTCKKDSIAFVEHIATQFLVRGFFVHISIEFSEWITFHNLSDQLAWFVLNFQSISQCFSLFFNTNAIITFKSSFAVCQIESKPVLPTRATLNAHVISVSDRLSGVLIHLDQGYRI